MQCRTAREPCGAKGWGFLEDPERMGDKSGDCNKGCDEKPAHGIASLVSGPRLIQDPVVRRPMVFHDDGRRAVLRDLHLAGKLELRMVRSKGADGFSAEFGVGPEPFSRSF